MACPDTRNKAARIILEVVRSIKGDESISENTSLGEDGLGVDDTGKATFFFAIQQKLKEQDCELKDFSVAAARKAKKVSDLVDSLWKDFNPEGTK